MSRTTGSMSGPKRIVAGGGSAPKAASSRRRGTLGRPTAAALATVWRNRRRVVFMEGIPSDPEVGGDSALPTVANARRLECTRNRAAFQSKGHSDPEWIDVSTRADRAIGAGRFLKGRKQPKDLHFANNFVL